MGLVTILSDPVRGSDKEIFLKPQSATELMWGALTLVFAMFVAIDHIKKELFNSFHLWERLLDVLRKAIDNFANDEELIFNLDRSF
jgi:hypothetical protein